MTEVKAEKKKKLNLVKVKPTGDRIIVRPDAAEDVSAGGIIIPDTAKEKPQRGTVIAVGRGTYQEGVLVPMECKNGNKIIYGKWAGTPLDVDGEEFLIMRESDVLAIM